MTVTLTPIVRVVACSFLLAVVAPWTALAVMLWSQRRGKA